MLVISYSMNVPVRILLLHNTPVPSTVDKEIYFKNISIFHLSVLFCCIVKGGQ